MKKSTCYPVFMTAFMVLILSTMTTGYAHPGSKKEETASTVYNYCVKYAYDLNTLPSALKDVPNTLIKNTSEFYLIGYSGFAGTDTVFKPHFTVRDRYQNEIASYHLNFFVSEDGEYKNHIYLMDMSEITSRESFFITGFARNADGGPVCMPFMAEIDLQSGNILQLSRIDDSRSIVPYHIIVNEDHGQVLVAGEEFEEPDFDPMDPSLSTGITFGDPPGQGLVICSSIDDIGSIQWSYQGTLMMTSGGDNAGSSFEHISLTPQGYCIVGKMTVVADPNFFYNYTTRIEAFLLDFGGGIMWQKSLKLNNSYVRGVSSHYAEAFDKVFILFQDYYNHTYGLFSVEHSSGSHGPLSYVFGMPGETNTSRIVSASSDERQITVGGLSHNIHHPGTFVFSPFFAKFEYEDGPDTFRFASGFYHENFNSFDDGIDFNSPRISNYFNWTNHSFGMFDVDKWPDPGFSGLETYLYALKDSTYNSVQFYRINYDHCGCAMEYRDLGVIAVHIPDSPQVYLDYLDINPGISDGETVTLTRPAWLICGNPDDPDAFLSEQPTTTSFAELSEAAHNDYNNVAVYDILGRLLYTGTYKEFLKNIDTYNMPMQVVVIVDLETRESRKVIYIR